MKNPRAHLDWAVPIYSSGWRAGAQTGPADAHSGWVEDNRANFKLGGSPEDVMKDMREEARIQVGS